MREDKKLSDQRHSSVKHRSRLSQSSYDFHEETALHIARQYFLAYTNPERPHWENAMNLAVVAYGKSEGPLIAFGVMRVLQAMRRTRKNVFNFVHPCCKACADNLTDCERLLINTIQHIRGGDFSSAQMDALILCEGFDQTPLLSSVQELVSLIEIASVSSSLIADKVQ